MNVVMLLIVWSWICAIPESGLLSMLHCMHWAACYITRFLSKLTLKCVVFSFHHCMPAVAGAGTATAAAATDVFNLRVSTNRPVPQSACSCGKQ